MAIHSSNYFVKLLILLSCFCLFECQNSATPNINISTQSSTPAPSARQAWIKMDKDLKSLMGKTIRKLLPSLMREIYKKEISSTCLGALMQVSSALKQSKLWPYKMLDASGKFPEGFLSGQLTALGNYEECLKIDMNEAKLQMKGQYCTLSLHPPIPEWKPYTSIHLPVPELTNLSAPDSLITYLANFIHNTHVTSIKIGLCVPHKCTQDDVHRLAQIFPEMLGLEWKFNIDSCEVKTAAEFSTSQAIALCFVSIICFLVVVGTIVDQSWSSEELEERGARATIINILKCFSFPGSGKKISNYVSPQEKLSFIHGSMFFCLFWIVIANTFEYANYDVASNFIEALGLVRSLFYEIVLNRIFPLQALLYLCGFVTAYKWLKSPEVNPNVFKFIFKRYWRYTPTYALVIAVILMTPMWGSGPTWTKNMSPFHNNCKDNWWYNILYINNFIDTNKACLDHTWVFAVAAQLYLVSIFVLIPLKLRPTIGLMVNLTLGLASLISVALTNVYYDLPPNEMSAFLHPKDRNVYAEHSYYRAYTHLSLYCTGIFVAHLMIKKPDIKISRKMTWFLWMTTGAAYLGALCSVHEWRDGPMPSPLTGAIYSTASKVAECCFLAWATVACMTSRAGCVKCILSWRPFAFFARLTFIAYLIHAPVITIVNAFKKSHIFVMEFEIFYLVLSYLSATYLMAYILHLFMEAPFLSLTDVLRKRCREKTFNSIIDIGNAVITEKPLKYCQKSNEKANGKSWKPTIDRSNC